jgi:hypothetical protein
MSEAINTLYPLTIWYHPARTVRSLNDSGHGHGLALVVAALFGFIQASPLFLSQSEGGVEYFLAGAVFGLSGLYLFSWLMRNFGRWFGAQAQVREVRTGLGLSLMPWLVLFAVLFWLRQTLGPEALEPFYWLFFLGFVYGYTIILLSLAAALRLSVLKTFLCLIVTFVVSLFPLTLMLRLMFPQLVPAQ